MAVPKRKQSRSNTRSRRSQWKTTVPTLAECSNRACGEFKPAAPGLPGLRPVRRPPGRRGLIAARLARVPGSQNVDAAELSRRARRRSRPELAELALTHRSYAYENGGLPTNERLEFLGDAVLGLFVTDALFRRTRTCPRASWRSCGPHRQHARAGRGRGADRSRRARPAGQGRGADRRPDEAVAAGRRRRGGDRCRLFRARPGGRPRLVLRLFGELITAAPSVGAGLDWKTSPSGAHRRTRVGRPGLPAARVRPRPRETLHRAYLAGADRGSGEGRTKKEAEQKAAALAYACCPSRSRRPR